MNSKQLGFLIILATSVASAQELEINSKNLRSFIAEKNAKVQASTKNAQASSEREGSLTRSFLPSLEVFAGQEQFKSGRNASKSEPAYGAELKVNLFNGGRDHLENEVRKLATDKKEYEVDRVLSEELEKARDDYWQVLYLRDKIEILKVTAEANRQNLTSAERRIKSGVATESDRVEFEMKDVELKQDGQRAQIELQSRIRGLGILIGATKLDVNTFVEKLDHEHDYEVNLKHDARDHDFLVKESQIQAEQNRLLAKKDKREWWPKLDAYAGYQQYNQRDKDFADAQDRTETVVGVRMSLSLSAGLEKSREGAALDKEAEASEAIAGFQKKEIEAHLDSEMAELRLLHNQVHEAEENIRRAEKYYRITQSEYARGVKNSPDVLGASEKLFEARHRRLEIIRDFQLAKSHVLSKIGK